MVSSTIARWGTSRGQSATAPARDRVGSKEIGQEFGGVADLDGKAFGGGRFVDAATDLHGAAGTIHGGDGGAGFLDVGELALQNGRGDFGQLQRIGTAHARS